MNELDVLKTIAAHLSERKKSAALSNYKVLCNTIRQANELFNSGVEAIKRFHTDLGHLLKTDENVVDDAKAATTALFYFPRIVPAILANDIHILHKFVDSTRADDRRQGITIESLDKLRRGFIDYNDLATTTRQLFDSLVANAYQLILLDAKETNYQVLQSLRSFHKFASRSLVQLVFDPDLEDSLRQFESLTIEQQLRGEESDITKSSNSNFKEKVGVLFKELALADFVLLEKIDSIFKFSSDFTHVGYVSTHLAGADVAEVVFGDDDGPYLPSTENFSELKYDILVIANRFLAEVYIPSLIRSMEQILLPDCLLPLREGLETTSISILGGMATHFQDYFFPIKVGLIGSSETIDLPCRCGHVRHWQPPHEDHERFCENCGSTFGLLVLDGGGYIMTGEGPVRILGSTEPQISESERARLIAEYFPKPSTDLEKWNDEQFQKFTESERDILSTLVHVGSACDEVALEFLLEAYDRGEILSTLSSLESNRFVIRRADSIEAANFLTDAATRHYPKTNESH